MIMDMQTAKAVMLMPEKKFAVAFDGEQMKKEMEKSTGRPSPSMFEMVRRLVREGVRHGREDRIARHPGTRRSQGRRFPNSSQQHDRDDPLGRSADGPADSRGNHVSPMMEGQMVLSNFRYDVDWIRRCSASNRPRGTRSKLRQIPRCRRKKIWSTSYVLLRSTTTAFFLRQLE